MTDQTATPATPWGDFLTRAQALEARMRDAARPRRILAIDPGPDTSGVVLVEAWPQAYRGVTATAVPRVVEAYNEIENRALLERVPQWGAFKGALGLDAVVIEKIEFMGMAVGRPVFETVHWSGRFYQAFVALGFTPARQPFAATRLALLGSRRATEAQVKDALLSLHGFADWRAAKGSKADPGPWAALTGPHAWSALALAVGFVLELSRLDAAGVDPGAVPHVVAPAQAPRDDAKGASIAGDGWPIGADTDERGV